MTWVSSVAVLASAFSLSLVLQPVVIRVLRRYRVLDHPTNRSSHASPVPRGGGIAVVVAIIASVLWRADVRAGAVLLAVALAALLGLTEDVVGIPIRRRLLLQAVSAAPLVVVVSSDGGLAGESAWWTIPLVVAFFVATVNAVNFMDGINGITAAVGAAAGAWYSIYLSRSELDALALVAAATAAASLGFAPYNVPRARVFLGDSGSYGLGAALGGLAFLTWFETGHVVQAVAPLTLYFADTGTALVRRIRSGEAWHLPHRTHVYQCLVDRGFSHARVSSLVLCAVCLAGGLGSIAEDTKGAAAAATGLAVLLALYLSSPRIVDRRRMALGTRS